MDRRRCVQAQHPTGSFLATVDDAAESVDKCDFTDVQSPIANPIPSSLRELRASAFPNFPA